MDGGAGKSAEGGEERGRDGLTIRAQRAHFTPTSSKPMRVGDAGGCALLREEGGEKGERARGGAGVGKGL